MEPWLQTVVTILCSVAASSGFWAFITQRLSASNSQAEMLRGLGHDRIVELGMRYIERGYITKDEYENLNGYLYKPYAKLKGNGSAERIMQVVDTLPICDPQSFRPDRVNCGPNPNLVRSEA